MAFNISDFDVTKSNKTDDGKTVKVKAKDLPIGEKAFVPFTAPLNVLYVADTNGIFHFKSIGGLKALQCTGIVKLAFCESPRLRVKIVRYVSNSSDGIVAITSTVASRSPTYSLI